LRDVGGRLIDDQVTRLVRRIEVTPIERDGRRR
jgi:hypothetical protein